VSARRVVALTEEGEAFFDRAALVCAAILERAGDVLVEQPPAARPPPGPSGQPADRSHAAPQSLRQ
jgi:hypothetical protein